MTMIMPNTLLPSLQQRSVDVSCGLLIVPLFRGSSRFESLILSHHSKFKFTCACSKEEIHDDDDDDAQPLPQPSQGPTSQTLHHRPSNPRFSTLSRLPLSFLLSSECGTDKTDKSRPDHGLDFQIKPFNLFPFRLEAALNTDSLPRDTFWEGGLKEP